MLWQKASARTVATARPWRPARVHPGVGAPGHRQLHRLRQPQHRTDRRFQLTLDGPAAALPGPAGELRAVVGQVQPNPYETGYEIAHAVLLSTRNGPAPRRTGCGPVSWAPSC